VREALKVRAMIERATTRNQPAASDVRSIAVAQPVPVISVVVPVYRGADCMDELYRRLVAALSAISQNFELVLVEDCGPDDSWRRIQALAETDARVRGIQFSRNFGQHYGISAGIHAARGEWIVVMDCDLQDRPEDIPALFAKAQQGYDIVLARRVARKHSWLKRTTSAAFYAVFRYFTELPYDQSVGNFRIISRQVANSFGDVREQLRFFGGIITWLGFRVTSVDVAHDARFAGETTYTWRKLFKLAVETVVAYSDKPLRLAIRIGFFMAASALLAGFVVLLRAFFGGITVSGWASLIVSLYFLSGIILGFMGVLGLYVGRVFDEVKGRPLYVIRERTFDL
jgi:polyisoprenyl-phosphate glycosyltransferase